MEYAEFLKAKNIDFKGSGVDCTFIPELAKPFQSDLIKWACKKGRAAIFANCGLGKTLIQLAYAKNVSALGDVLIVAPLAVTSQTKNEASKFGIDVSISRDGVSYPGITVTNYEMLHKFNIDDFIGVVLDESSILKTYNGKTRDALIDLFKSTSYKLECTATPSPNDYMELGNHSEFLGIMTRAEMLSKFFFHDGGETQKWTLKGHAEDAFWQWVSSWAVMLNSPTDIGHDGTDYVLPELTMHSHVVKSKCVPLKKGMLVNLEAVSLNEQRQVKRLTIEERCKVAAEIANESVTPVLIWCDLNDEGDLLEKLIPDACQVSGSQSNEEKERLLLGFSDGAFRVLITKPKIGGFGMNWQHCSTVIFVGVTHSYEMYYQNIRRCWRFGQLNPVSCHVISADLEGSVVSNLKRKDADMIKMQAGILKHLNIHHDINSTTRMRDDYAMEIKEGSRFTAILGDTCDKIKEIGDNEVGYSIFSPPFSSLYTYSNSIRDLGNSDNEEQFIEHFRFIVKDMLRITKPGRLCSFHCMNMPTSKVRDGYIGIRDFRGELIKLFQEEGWIFHSEVVIWKNPVTAMQRTKALGLLHKQLCKDSAMSRQGVPDYLVTMRKPGINDDPVEGPLTYYCGEDIFPDVEDPTRKSIEIWQRYASPVWMDINPSNTLQKASAREDKDEKHICPLQLDVIERGIQLWTKPGDVVFSPFMGIGSEGYVALKMGRKFIGCELKQSYYDQAVINLNRAERDTRNKLF